MSPKPSQEIIAMMQRMRDDSHWYAFARGPDGWFVVTHVQWYALTPETLQYVVEFALANAAENGVTNPADVQWVHRDNFTSDQQWAVDSFWHGEYGLPKPPRPPEGEQQ